MIRDIALAHGDDPALRGRLRPYQLKALEAIATCGTEAAGMHVEVCDQCGDRRMAPNTCCNRNCPHCQGRERAAWVEARMQELLPCGYFHAVLTLPAELRPLTLLYPAVLLALFMKAASDAIDHLCRDPHHLGAEVGQLAVLHTWKRDLGWHPHVHIIVTAGGWDAARQRWIPARTYGGEKKAFLLPVDALRAAFQRRLQKLVLHAYRRGDFGKHPGDTHSALADDSALARHLTASMKKPWVIRIEPPYSGPEQLLKYLGAYINRVAISPKRILAHDPQAGTVTYTWTTNAEPDAARQDTLPAVEFLARFAQHILPPRFQRIRFRGLWSTAHRATKLRVVQQALAINRAPPPPPSPPPEPRRDLCTTCGLGHYHRLPGPCPRPTSAERRRIMALIRNARRTATPVEATTAA
jgi:hypothetical protein